MPNTKMSRESVLCCELVSSLVRCSLFSLSLHCQLIRLKQDLKIEIKLHSCFNFRFRRSVDWMNSIRSAIARRTMMNSSESSAVGPVGAALRQKIAEFFKPIHLEVECESRHHNVPKGAEKHFRVQIVSDKFEGLTQLQRQRMVNKLLAEELQSQIHALRIEAKKPSEWTGQAQVAAPPCLGGGKTLAN